MATKRKLEETITKFGGYWDKGYDTIDTPCGYVWRATGTHEYVMARDYDEMKFGKDDYLEAINSLELGLDKCPSNCEYCNQRLIFSLEN